jgi:hypothetical protein
LLAQLCWTQYHENLLQMAAEVNKNWLNLGVCVQNLNPYMLSLDSERISRQLSVSFHHPALQHPIVSVQQWSGFLWRDGLTQKSSCMQRETTSGFSTQRQACSTTPTSTCYQRLGGRTASLSLEATGERTETLTELMDLVCCCTCWEACTHFCMAPGTA